MGIRTLGNAAHDERCRLHSRNLDNRLVDPACEVGGLEGPANGAAPSRSGPPRGSRADPTSPVALRHPGRSDGVPIGGICPPSADTDTGAGAGAGAHHTGRRRSRLLQRGPYTRNENRGNRPARPSRATLEVTPGRRILGSPFHSPRSRSFARGRNPSSSVTGQSRHGGFLEGSCLNPIVI